MKLNLQTSTERVIAFVPRPSHWRGRNQPWHGTVTSLLGGFGSVVARRPDWLTGALLHTMALNYTLRPALRRLLRSRDGWLDFSVGVTTESGSVARTITFRSGRVRAHRGVASDVDVTLRFKDDDALLCMLRSTPDQVLDLILKNRLIGAGNWAYLQLFNYLISRLLGRQHQRKRDAAQLEEAASRRAEVDPREEGVARAREALRARPLLRLLGSQDDEGVIHLEDPYLSALGLEDFPRLQRFLDQHLTKKAAVCVERATVLTDWYRAHGFERRTDTGTPWDSLERQGRAFRHLMSQKTPVIRKGDLLPGTTTLHPVTGSAVFPDAQGAMIWGELDSIDKRPLIPFDLSRQAAHVLHHDVFPYWTRRNFREWVRARWGDQPSQQLEERWVAYFVWKSVGISHTIPDFETPLRLGTAGMAKAIRARRDKVGTSDPEAHVTFGAMLDCLAGVETYAAHLAQHAEEEAAECTDPARRDELLTLASTCRRVPREPARTLHEAFTSIWILWVALHNENADTGLSLGRLDQLLQPYFDSDMRQLDAGTTDSSDAREAYIKSALELAGAFFLRCADHFPLSPDIGNTLFGGASSTQALTLGGVRADGSDAVNDMTYILLKATEMLCPRDVNVNARYLPGTSSETYLRRLCEVNFITAGTPSMHNDAAVFAGLAPHGYAIEDIRDWAATGCVESTIAGRHMGHTGSILMNLVAALEMALHDGRHPLIYDHVGPHTGALKDTVFPAFDDFFGAFATQLAHLIGLAVQHNNRLAEMHAEHRPTPLLSALMGGTLQSGRDVTRGGATFNSSGTSNIGLADVTDSLLVMEELVYRTRRVTLSELAHALASDFEEAPALRAFIQNRVPRFGSGDPHAVDMANRVAKLVHDTWGQHRNFRGGPYTCGFWSMSQHVAYGNLSGALPSGRRATKAFTPGLTPQPGASKSFLDNIRDVAQLDPTAMDNNMAFNVKLTPSAEDSREKTVSTMAAYVKTYFEQGGMQLQFNVVTADTLRDAMAHPEQYRGLLVRISGYNAYFVTLNRQIQRELIERAEFGL